MSAVPVDQEVTINFDRVNDTILVGSCLRGKPDALNARQGGASVVFSLQDETDLANQSLDVAAVASACDAEGVKYIRFATSDADEQELQERLPAAVAAFGRAVEAARTAGGAAYVHCNGGRGRAPTIVVAFLYWLGGMSLTEANDAMTAARKSKPKLPIIAAATADLLGGTAPAEDAEGTGALSARERAAIKTALDALV